MKSLLTNHQSIKFVMLFLLTMLMVTAVPGLQANTPPPSLELLVQPAVGIDIEVINTRYGTSVIASIPSINIYKLLGDSHVLAAMTADPDISRVQANIPAESIEMNPYYFTTGSGTKVLMNPNFSINAVGETQQSQGPDLYFNQWAISQIRANQAHSLTKGEGSIVAVLDTGIYQQHPALIDRVIAGYDFVDNDTDPNDVPDGIDNDGDGYIDEGAGHGTHVAGIVALTAPDALLMPVRVLNSDGAGTYFDLIAGINYAVNNGAHIINLSLGGPDDAGFLRTAVDYASANGVLVVAAAGAYQMDYPAIYENVISVGASDMQDMITGFSTFSTGFVDVFAPGVEIYSTYFDGDFTYWTGTSMAAPFVSAEAALILSLGNCDTTCVTNLIINETSPVIPFSETQGRIDLYRALQTTQQNSNQIQ